MIDWHTAKIVFKRDGSRPWHLPSITGEIHTRDHWRALWPVLREHPGLEFSDGLPLQCPTTVEEMFEVMPLPLGPRPVLRLRVGRALLIVHYRLTEIACSVDPPQDVSESDLHALLTFMRQVGDTIGARVVAARSEGPIAFPGKGDSYISFGKRTVISYDPQTQDFDSWEEWD